MILETVIGLWLHNVRFCNSNLDIRVCGNQKEFLVVKIKLYCALKGRTYTLHMECGIQTPKHFSDNILRFKLFFAKFTPGETVAVHDI